MHRVGRPIDALVKSGRDEKMLPGPPVATLAQHVADRLALAVDQKVKDMSDGGVARFDPIAHDFLAGAQMPVAQIPLVDREAGGAIR
jgi:hypothetical protein